MRNTSCYWKKLYVNSAQLGAIKMSYNREKAENAILLF